MSSYMRTILMLINKTFCNPSLAEAELEGIINSLESHVDTENKVGRKQQQLIPEIVKEMLTRYDNLLFCSAETLREWFKWNGIFWKQIDIIEVRDLIYNLIIEVAPGSERISLINDVLVLISIKMIRSITVPPGNCINFLNGILDLEKMELVLHNPNLNFLHVIKVNYSSEAYPSKELQDILLSFVSGDKMMLNLLRGACRRIIQPCVDMQTGFWLYGPPGTGKSTLLSFLRELVPSRCVELSCSKSNIFERDRLMHALLIIISEGDYLNLKTVRLLKIILGRDPFPFDIKHENVDHNASFQSEAVVFVTSNQNLPNSLVNLFDRAIFDRIFQIPFTNVPSQPLSGLKDYLFKNLSAIVNWSLYTPKEVLKAQIRVGPFIQLTLEDNPFIDFIVTTLTEDKDGFLSNAELLDLLDDHFKGNPCQPLNGLRRKRAPRKILDLLKVFFKFDVKNARVGNKRGIRGIRRIDSKSDKSLIHPKMPFKALDMDPFSRERIVSYEEIRQEIFEKKHINKQSLETQEKNREITQPLESESDSFDLELPKQSKARNPPQGGD